MKSFILLQFDAGAIRVTDVLTRGKRSICYLEADFILKISMVDCNIEFVYKQAYSSTAGLNNGVFSAVIICSS